MDDNPILIAASFRIKYDADAGQDWLERRAARYRDFPPPVGGCHTKAQKIIERLLSVRRLASEKPCVGVGPSTATTMSELTTLTQSGVTIERGDAVTLRHEPSGSVAHGTMGTFYGVGRIRGVMVIGTQFGDRCFVFGQPGDDERGWSLTPKEESEADR